MNTQTNVQKQHEVGLGLFLGGLAVLILIGLLVSAYSRNPCAARPSLKGATSCNKECCARIRVVGDKTNANQLRGYVSEALRTLDAFEQKANERGATPATGLIVIGDGDNNRSRVQKTVDVCGVTTSIANRAALTASANDARARFIAFFESVTGEGWTAAAPPPAPIAPPPVKVPIAPPPVKVPIAPPPVKTPINSGGGVVSGGVVIPTITRVTKDQVAVCEAQIAKYNNFDQNKYEQNKRQRALCVLCAAISSKKYEPPIFYSKAEAARFGPNYTYSKIQDRGKGVIALGRSWFTALLVNSKQHPTLTVAGVEVNGKHGWPSFVKTDRTDQWRLDVDLLNINALPMTMDPKIMLKEPEANFSVEEHKVLMNMDYRGSLGGIDIPVIAIKGGEAMSFTSTPHDPSKVEWTAVGAACKCTVATL